METETAHDSGPGENGGDRCSHKDPHAVLTGSILGSSIWLSSGSHFMFVSVSGYIYWVDFRNWKAFFGEIMLCFISLKIPQLTCFPIMESSSLRIFFFFLLKIDKFLDKNVNRVISEYLKLPSFQFHV